jgi:DNA-binding NarL/FixJ family response regulator
MVDIAHPLRLGSSLPHHPQQRLTTNFSTEIFMNTAFQPLRAMTRHNDPLLAAGILAALEAAPGIEIATSCGNAPFPDVDVLICDYESGMELMRNHRSRGSAAPRKPGVVVVTWRDCEADVRTAMQSGIGGYLMGNCSLNQLVEAVRCVDRGLPYLCQMAAARVAKSLTRTPLTMRESEILQLMARGLPNKLIASQLCIALGTVKAHAKAIMDKLDAGSRTEATVIAAQRGLLAHKSPLLPASARSRYGNSPTSNQTHRDWAQTAA